MIYGIERRIESKTNRWNIQIKYERVGRSNHEGLRRPIHEVRIVMEDNHTTNGNRGIPD